MKKVFISVGLLVVLLACGVLWYTSALKPVDVASDTRIKITIEKGSSLASIAALLKEKELIQSTRAFKIYTQIHDLQGVLQAGSFILRSSYSVADIVEILQTGKAEEMAVTIPEGFTVLDIDTLLAKKELANAGEFLHCTQTCDLSEYTFLPDSSDWLARGGQVEGYLFPDTYFVAAENFTVEKFMKRMLTSFQLKIIRAKQLEFAASPYSVEQIVNMASLIEEEASNDKERPVIAGILWKRFDEGMGLGVDATVRYVVNKPSDAITIADLNNNSPYNTRKFRELPPGPIANPGAKSIQAALEPEKSRYWYYLHGNDGEIRYAKTNEEHNSNRNMYLK